MIKKPLLFVLGTLLIANSYELPALEKKVAVSLSYDDALPSQLDNALPALNRYNFKASFYLVPSAKSIQSRLKEWRIAAKQGHELGNHSLFHPCSGSKPHREWVSVEQDLDNYTLARATNEVLLVNTFLATIDGRVERTFTPPCFDTEVAGKDYIEPLKAHFVAIKGIANDDPSSILWAPSEVTGTQLIEYVQNAPSEVTLINILFHGIGGDHLAVSSQAHDELLAYLAANQHRYYVDSYINIIKSRR